MASSIDQRVIVFPLALNSSTKDPAVALEFIDNSVENSSEKVPLIYRIHVLNCDEELLAEYKARFPKSVVKQSRVVNKKTASKRIQNQASAVSIFKDSSSRILKTLISFFS